MTAEQHTLAKYLLELTMVDYEMVSFPPSIVACAALALTLRVLDVGEWVRLGFQNWQIKLALYTKIKWKRILPYEKIWQSNAKIYYFK